MTHPGGRPKITLDDLPEGWEEKIIELASQGASQKEIRYHLALEAREMSHVLFNRLLNDEEEFCETIKKGLELAQGWWEKEGRVNLKDKDFNYTGWYMNMKNRFGWKDKSEQDSRQTHILQFGEGSDRT